RRNRCAHYRMPRVPADRDLYVLDLLARQAADWIERIQAEEAMRESEGRFRGTFENAAVGIAHTDADGRFLRVNETYCRVEPAVPSPSRPGSGGSLTPRSRSTPGHRSRTTRRRRPPACHRCASWWPRTASSIHGTWSGC